MEFLGLLPPSGWARHFSVFTLKIHFLTPGGASNQTITAINSPMEYLSNSVDLLLLLNMGYAQYIKPFFYLMTYLVNLFYHVNILIIK